MIEKLLVANRGEIAVRVMRTAHEMGMTTLAVASAADLDSVHAGYADELVEIGPGPAPLSYLAIDRILEAARVMGADAIHPGYGFLSERPEFAEACAQHGLIFVGPSAEAMRRLGSKSAAKALAVAAGVPVVPGCFDPGASDATLEKAAREIGYPVMLKASAGGGGRGMRLVEHPDQFRTQLQSARTEALSAFGDGTMMVEKYVTQPRHVEVQVIADHHGQVAALFERECSPQRRHQKLLEEAPAPFEIDWTAMRRAAVDLIRAAEYTNAGTVEFIVNGQTGEFYFLEVNARLQVEHPVTEAITGVDLVRMQLEVASGLPLSLPESLLNGDRSYIRGHCIEARVVAEDPANGWIPSSGRIIGWAPPRVIGVRLDTGFGAGREVPPFYDSLLAKVIAHGPDRATAISRLKAALEDFHILGVTTNIAYLLDVLASETYVAGEFDTQWLERSFSEWSPSPVPQELGDILIAGAEVAADAGGHRRPGAWGLADAFRNVRPG